jgi:hypothetical protein
MLRRVGVWVAAAIVVMWVLKDPDGAARLVQEGANLISQAAASLGDIARRL